MSLSSGTLVVCCTLVVCLVYMYIPIRDMPFIIALYYLPLLLLDMCFVVNSILINGADNMRVEDER
jgi:putative copper export protein